MKRYLTLVATTGIVTALAFSAFAGQQNQNNNNAQQSSNNKGQNAEWSYSGKNGPENWGNISKQYSLCKEGSNQSPVNISGFKQTNLPKINVEYKNSPLQVSNNGHTIQVNYNAGSYINVGGQKYALKQIQFHTPSEHTIQGKNSPIELHLVHKNQQGQISVVAVMVEQGKENSELQKILNNAPKKPGQQVSYNNIQVNAKNLVPQNQQYFSYNGSLTTPPCSEQVQWFVYKQPIQASKQQINEFKEVYQYNARPQQPLKGRQIQGS